MKERVLKLMDAVSEVTDFLLALHKKLGDVLWTDETARQRVRLAGVLEDHPPAVQDAVKKWMREKDCRLEDVPVIRAAGAYLVDVALDIERSFYRDKSGIMVAQDQDIQLLLDRLADDLETDDGLADYLQVELFTSLPETLRRARRVRPLVIAEELPVRAGRRYREAVWCYLLGQAIACCALCRVVLETALKELLERLLEEQISLDRVTLRDLIERASRVGYLSDQTLSQCRTIKSVGDRAVHGDVSPKLEEAYETLAATQQVLKAIFGRPPALPSR